MNLKLGMNDATSWQALVALFTRGVHTSQATHIISPFIDYTLQCHRISGSLDTGGISDDSVMEPTGLTSLKEFNMETSATFRYIHVHNG